MEPAHSLRVGLLRRLGSVLYDSLLVLALWMVLGLGFVLAGSLTGRNLIPLQFVSNLLVAWAFFFGFWTRTGQTLGMQTWNIAVRDREGGGISRWQATLRYLVALSQWLIVLMAVFLAREHGPAAGILASAVLVLALGLSQLHPERLMLHDWLSGTRLVRLRHHPGSGQELRNLPRPP
jgi:uncharacterized RDD family membrane protein YckC